MGSISGEELTQWDRQGSSAHEEKILVSVRLRPLNGREFAKNDGTDWECINNTTVLFKNNLPERSMFPTAYTFDRVFACDCSTKQVYEEGAKKVALSGVSGINSSIFAYGQTSSGKTYTMCGITEHAVVDIYDYIHRHNEREFVLKFSAMEIYNESVRDLLSSDSTPLRLLDDPERGTVVEKLTEVNLRDWSHLKELLSVCEAERQIGETSLNEMSSRSHQILRLTIDSSAREFLGAENSSTLAATVNFVDLAGSERTSQSLSGSSRLKEGCHINRSLLTLGTVIRKLSKGKTRHVPYRDSKLTRILQNSLGGNSRTAIICTMSPAHSHVEQSRNTLLFGMCAKEVNTNAQVNVVMSEKELVKQLQRELARLESELRSLGSGSAMGNSASLLKEKDFLIEKKDKEITELTRQCNLAQSRVEDLLQSARDYQIARPWVVDPHCLDVASNTSHSSDRCDGLISNKCNPQIPENFEDNFLSDCTSPSLFMNKYFGLDTCHGWEDITQKTNEDSEDNCKEVRCIEMESSIGRNIKTDAVSSPRKGDKDLGHIHTDHDMQTTIDCLISPCRFEHSPCSSDTDISDSRSINLTRSSSCKAILTTMLSSPLSEKAEHNESTPPNGFEKDFPGGPEVYEAELTKLKPDANNGIFCRKDSQTSVGSVSMDEKEQNINMSSEDDSCHLDISSTGLNDVIKPKSEKQFGNEKVQELEPDTKELGKSLKDNDGLDKVDRSLQCPSNWAIEFASQRKKIIELWDACNISLLHRTYFFLLFKGDPSESVYMEVELKQLSFIRGTMFRGTKTVQYGQFLTLASRMKALNRERGMLSKQFRKKFLAKDKKALYQKWGIKLDTKKRKLQLFRRIWTNTTDMDHIKESAALVAKLVGFEELCQAPKEMFGLNFSAQPADLRSYNLKHSMSSLK